jgi:hypothetical protein
VLFSRGASASALFGQLFGIKVPCQGKLTFELSMKVKAFLYIKDIVT